MCRIFSSLALQASRAHDDGDMSDTSSPLQAIFFDLDGTLIDSITDLAEAVNRMLDDRRFPRREQELFYEYVGDGVRQLVQRALPDNVKDEATVEACVAEYQRHYEDLWHDKTQPYPGIVEALAALRAQGLKMGVISNKPHHFTLLCCAHFFAPGTFDAVLGQRAEVPRKPDAAGALEMAASLGVPVSACAYVGDSGVDMKFGVNSGMRRIGVRWGFRSEQELLANGAELMVSTAAEIVAWAKAY